MTEDRWTDEREVRIRAAPEQVWAAWAEPEHVKRWFSDDASGSPTEGGELLHVFEGFGEQRYRVLEADPPRRLVLEADIAGQAMRQVVEIQGEEGSTVLRLVHSGFGSTDPDDEIARGTDSGWIMALSMLRHYVEHRFGRDKRTVAVFRPASFDYARLLSDHYLAAEGLGRWLTDGRSGIEPWDPVGLTLTDGTPLTGRVIALSEQEVAVTWEEADGVLELKAFGAGPDRRMLGVRLMTWSDDDAMVDRLATELEGAVGRLVDAVASGVTS